MHKGVYTILALAFFYVVGSIFQSAYVDAMISGQLVELNVPSTTLKVTGISAKQALLTIELNDVVITSTTSDNDGFFSQVATSPSSGVQKVSVQYEVEGRKSVKQTKNVSLQPQQQTTVEFLLPPILYKDGSSEVNVSQNIVLQGYSVPNTTVTLQSSTGFSLQTIANLAGRYTFLVSGGQFSASEVSFTSSYEFSGQDSPQSNIVTINIGGLDSQLDSSPGQQPILRPDIIVNPLQPAPPIVISPRDTQLFLNGNSVVFSGRAQIGAQIIVYANGRVAGSVTVNQDGEWEFFYTSTEERVIFQFSVCVGQSCSLPSQSIEVKFMVIPEACDVDLRLDEYRFWNVSTEDSITLKSDPYAVDLEVSVDWGDGSIEKFSYDAKDQFIFEHAYNIEGLYNGSIRVIGQECEQERFFSVNVVDQLSSKFLTSSDVRNILIILGILSPISLYFHRRTLP